MSPTVLKQKSREITAPNLNFSHLPHPDLSKNPGDENPKIEPLKETSFSWEPSFRVDLRDVFPENPHTGREKPE